MRRAAVEVQIRRCQCGLADGAAVVRQRGSTVRTIERQAGIVLQH
jgi:hypothetical protein